MSLRAVQELLFASDVGNFGARWRVWSARRATPVTMRDLAAAVGRRAKVAGVASPLGEVAAAAPFTQRAALAWRTKLDETRMNETGTDDRVGVRGIDLPNDDPFGYRDLPVTDEWRTRVREGSALVFAVDDETGGAIVDARHAVLAFPYERVDDHARVNDENPALREYLGRHGVSTTMYMGMTGNHRFFEGVVCPGDRISVWGVVTESTGVDAAGYRDAVSRMPAIVGTPRDPCVILERR